MLCSRIYKHDYQGGVGSLKYGSPITGYHYYYNDNNTRKFEIYYGYLDYDSDDYTWLNSGTFIVQDISSMATGSSYGWTYFNDNVTTMTFAHE